MNDKEVRYPLVLRAVMESVWAVMPAKLAEVCHLLAVRASGATIPQEEIASIVAASNPRKAQQQGAIAVVPVLGVLTHRMGGMSEMSGGTSTQRLSGQLAALANDPAIGTIVLDIDSPGGEVSGIPELAAQIRAIRQNKRVVAVANTLAASAAFWLGSQASEFIASPSAEVGSIGVVVGHEDLSAALEKEGIAITLVTAGKFKAEGNPFEPLSDEARAALQVRVDEVFRMFTMDVAEGRDVRVSEVRTGFGEGRVVGAREAVKLGMVDRVATLDQTLARLVSRGGKGQIGAYGTGHPALTSAVSVPTTAELEDDEEVKRQVADMLAKLYEPDGYFGPPEMGDEGGFKLTAEESDHLLEAMAKAKLARPESEDEYAAQVAERRARLSG